MIHFISEEILKLPLHEYTLTFDDGTADHYDYWHQLKTIPTHKYFFITTDWVDKPGYITLDQLKELKADPHVTIGGHGHRHIDLHKIPSLLDKVNNIKQDTEEMLEWFDRVLSYKPTAFCYPYNNNHMGLYHGLLARYGFTEFFGHERIPVERLLQT